MKKKKQPSKFIKGLDTMKTDRFYAIWALIALALVMWRIDYFMGQ